MKIAAVIVSYNPDIQHLGRLCERLGSQGARIIVVDNSETSSLAGLSTEHCSVVRLGENTGIAHAQNVGIRNAVASGADVVVLFDQDSEPATDYLSRLLMDVRPSEPGVVAPLCIDGSTLRELASFRLGRFGWARKVVSGGRDAPYPVDLVISSGCAASAITFSVVGLMDEDFFIDFVDFEWCLRCRRFGVPINVSPAAVVKHAIGESVVGHRWFRGSVHSPSRSYYKIRNCFLLFRKPDVPILFAFRATILALIHAVLLLPFVKNRWSYVRMMLLGIWHGLSGVVGRNPVPS